MSTFVVSARKYRPTTFDEVIGQNHVAGTLKKALKADKLAHAFLFCGPRGIGKTTCARILAKVINCENVTEDKDPCNTCSSCTSFNDNASFNIIELDAASNNSVEHIRTLIEQVRFQPQQGKYKVFIIDEVHMLSSQAFNAFLKTLEEPPPYAIFILATTEKHKIIPTILSRCQIFDFKRIQVEDIVSQLQLICDKEGKTAEAEALHLIARKADGAMRDALSIFDKINSSSGEAITYKDVISNLNILDYDYYFKVTDACIRQDLPQVLLTLNEIMQLGFDPEQFIQGFSEHLRELMVCKDPSTLALLEASENIKERYFNQSSLTSKSFLLSALNIMNQCDIHYPKAKNKRLHAEIALSKITYLNTALTKSLIDTTEDQKKKTEVNVEHTDSKTEALFPQKAVTESSQIRHEPKQPEKEELSELGTVMDIEEEPEPKIEEKKTEPVIVENTPAKPVVQESNTGMIINTPSFSSIDHIMTEVKQEEAAKKAARQKLSIDGIRQIWKKYASHNPSKSVQSALNVAEIDLNDKTLGVAVPSPITKDIILQETGLMDMIRKEMGTEDILINIFIDRQRFPDFEEAKPKILLSNREKYEHMVSKNPSIAKLRNVFKLKVDAD